MFLTAHRVVSLATGRTGINAFHYQHGEATPVDWTNPDPALVSEAHPGVLVAEDIELAPGGNLVRSYLDVVAQDSTPTSEIEQALDRFRESALDSLPALRRGEVGLRFGAEMGLDPEARSAEIDVLRDKALRLLRSPPASGWRTLDPLVIEMKVSPGETSFHLAPSAVERLRGVVAPGWTPAAIRVRSEVREDLAFFRGDILRDLVRSLIPDVREEDLLLLGGVRVVTPSGALVTEWPVRHALGTGYCLSCHRHNTLTGDGLSWRCAACRQVQSDNGLWVAALT